jgi:hypothetical protein
MPVEESDNDEKWIDFASPQVSDPVHRRRNVARYLRHSNDYGVDRRHDIVCHIRFRAVAPGWMASSGRGASSRLAPSRLAPCAACVRGARLACSSGLAARLGLVAASSDSELLFAVVGDDLVRRQWRSVSVFFERGPATVTSHPSDNSRSSGRKSGVARL